MASNQAVAVPYSVVTRELIFAGDEVRLAGQIDYPTTPSGATGYPLIFILHHAGCNAREDYDHFAQMGIANGYAVFRWDKRGTGRSGASARGSATQDAIYAYETALDQPSIDRRRVVILALGAGTALLGNTFGLFARAQHPYAALLVANMLDTDAIRAIDCRIKIITSEQDWNPWQVYGEAACHAHRETYKRHGASYYVAPDADRMLMISVDEKQTFHDGARKVICDWLKHLTQVSRSV